MGTISTRVPEELEAELETYLETENLDRSTAVRKLLTERLAEWRREYALEQLAAGTVSLSRGAEIADVSVWEFTTLANERDVTWVDDEHAADDLDAI
jgi:predicted HTH domain antitoxin